MIGDLIRAKADQIGMRRKDVAAFLGVSGPTLISWVRGDTQPKPRFGPKVEAFLALEKVESEKPSATCREALKAERRAVRKEERKEARLCRAKRMAQMYADGMTLQQVGDMCGLTRERVRQLLSEAGVSRTEGGAAIKAAKRREAYQARRERECMAKHGMTVNEYSVASPRMKYAFQQQKRNAGTRGIEWRMNFAEWLSIWHQSGKWEQRGRGYGYVMARHGDSGPYEVGNVYICTGAQNASDSYQWKPAADRVAKRRQTMQVSA